MPDITGIHHLNLTVPDLHRSETWYTELLGLTKLREIDDPRFTKVLLRHPGSGLLLGLTQHKTGPPPETFSEFRTGLDHVAFAVADEAELAAWEARLTALRVPFSPPYESALGRVLVFRDPDNIQLEFYASRGT